MVVHGNVDPSDRRAYLMNSTNERAMSIKRS